MPWIPMLRQLKPQSGVDLFYQFDYVVKETKIYLIAEIFRQIDKNIYQDEEIDRILREEEQKASGENMFQNKYRTPLLLTFLIAFFNQTDFLKLNGNELVEVIQMYGHLPGSLEQNILFLSGITGDSFLAALIFQWLNHSAIDQPLRFAYAAGALVAIYKGANPEILVEEIQQMAHGNRVT